MHENSREFGVQLRIYRMSAQLTQQELAKRSGLTVGTIGNLERGRVRQPYRTTVQRLADALALRDTARIEFINATDR
jgi:transcriptional regulator with XRE-family HTH domain